MDNLELTDAEYIQIRHLDKFDLVMFLSELNDHGWASAKRLLPEIQKANENIARRN